MTTVLLLFQADREFFQFATLNRSIIVCFGIDICGTEIVHLPLYSLSSGSYHSTGIPRKDRFVRLTTFSSKPAGLYQRIRELEEILTCLSRRET